MRGLFETPYPPRPCQVVRTGAAGEDIRCKLTLYAASNVHNARQSNNNFNNKHNKTDGAVLALHDLSPSRPLLTTEDEAKNATQGTSDGRNLSSEAQNSVPFYLPLAKISQVRCHTTKKSNKNENETRKKLFSFVLLAHSSSTASRGGEHEAQACLRRGGLRHTFKHRAEGSSGLCDGGRPERQDRSGKGIQGDYYYHSRGQLLRRDQVEPFGVLQAGSDEQLSAIVLGVASVM